MSRCQYCKKLTHSVDMYVKFNVKDMDFIYELRRSIDWTACFMYTAEAKPKEIGMLKHGDIYIHFLEESENE